MNVEIVICINIENIEETIDPLFPGIHMICIKSKIYILQILIIIQICIVRV